MLVVVVSIEQVGALFVARSVGMPYIDATGATFVEAQAAVLYKIEKSANALIGYVEANEKRLVKAFQQGKVLLCRGKSYNGTRCIERAAIEGVCRRHWVMLLKDENNLASK